MSTLDAMSEESAGTVGTAGTAEEPAGTGPTARTGPESAYADCVLCGEPTEHPETVRGATLCPVCEWQEAQRTACSG